MLDISIAMIGAGYMAREHLRAFEGLPGVRLAGIASRTHERAEQLGKEFSIPAYPSIQALYEATQADLVVVTVPELSMAAVASQCFAHQWSVLLEKPAGYNLADATSIRNAARGRSVYVAFNRRAYSSTREALKALENVDAPRFIKVVDQQDQEAAMRDHGQPKLVAENYMFANSIHVIDYFRVFGRGKITDVTPVIAWNPKRPGVVVAKVNFDSGDVGLYEGIWNGPGPWSLTITTPHKRLELRPLEQGSLQLRETRMQIPLEISQDDTVFKPGLRWQAIQATAAVRGQMHSLATIDDSWESMKLVADIFGMK